jgi:hypothetical protein
MLGNWRCERNNAGWPRRWNDERGPPMTVHPKHILHTCYTLFNGWIHGKQTKFVCSPKFRSCIYTSILVSISQERPYIIFYDISSYLYYWRGYTNLRPNIYEAESLLHQYIISQWDRTPLGTNERLKMIQLFIEIKTGIHMTGYRQGESHHFHWWNSAGHRWGECDISIRVNEDRHIHDWAPMRWKSSSSSTHSVYIRRDDVAVMTIIIRSLIRGFLQTYSVDVINRTSFSHNALKIGELCNLWS